MGRLLGAATLAVMAAACGRVSFEHTPASSDGGANGSADGDARDSSGLEDAAGDDAAGDGGMGDGSVGDGTMDGGGQADASELIDAGPIDCNGVNCPTLTVTLHDTQSTSASVSPDIAISVDDPDGVVAFLQYRIVETGGDAIRPWTLTGTAPFRALDLSMVDGQQYAVEARALDEASRTGPVAQATFDVRVVNLPFDEATLGPAANLSDQSLNGTTLGGSTYTRTAPFEGATLSLGGTIGWTAGQPSALFLRADHVDFASGTVLHADGEDAADYDSGANGGDGGSGGGAGPVQTNDGIGGNGGSAGGNGDPASPSGGVPGTGYASIYGAGYTYGTGGAGAAGRGGSLCETGLALGGAGGNGAGGGGGAGCDWCWCIAGGGGGGGGLVVLVTETYSGSATLRARGGSGSESGTREGGGGGGGVVWFAARESSAGVSFDVSPGALGTGATQGTVRVFQINGDRSLTERRPTDQWTTDSVAF